MVPGVFSSMVQDDNRVCTELLGAPGGSCYDTPTPKDVDSTDPRGSMLIQNVIAGDSDNDDVLDLDAIG